jgi:hypothetical protein
MTAHIFEVTAITGRKFRIMSTSEELAVVEALKRMSQYEASKGAVATRRIETAG